MTPPPPPRRYEQIEYFSGVGADVSAAGWYVIYFDVDGLQYADVGPFETREQAEAVLYPEGEKRI